VSDAWQSAKIKQFEHVMVGTHGALVRITGRAPRRKSTAEPRPTLLADDGHVVRRFLPIPSPPDERGVVRAAYSVSADVLTPDTVFSLELAGGYVISLPAPTPGAARLTPEAETAIEPPPEAFPLEDAPAPTEDDRRGDVTAKLAELSAALAEAERDGAEHKAARAAAEADAEAVRDEARALGERNAALESIATETEQRLATAVAETETENEQWAARFSELETWRGELERRLTETTSELDAARTRLRQDETELRDTREQLADAEARAELAHAQLTGLQTQVAGGGGGELDARERIRQLESEREELARQARQLADRLRSADRLAELALDLAQARAQAERLRAAAGGDEDDADADADGEADATATATAELEAIGRRAETEAAERAARELADAAEARSPH
jgi:hypothetical protein